MKREHPWIGWWLVVPALVLAACATGGGGNGDTAVPDTVLPEELPDTGIPEDMPVLDTGEPPEDVPMLDTGEPPEDMPTTDLGPACLPPMLVCAGVCINPQADRTNCGFCGHDCGMGATCRSGSCFTTCATGQTLCGAPPGFCASLDSDPVHCGTCDTSCPTGQICSAGRCTVECLLPRAVCGTGSASRCVDLGTDATNCGTCGTMCPIGQSCVAGECRLVCSSGQQVCGLACVDPRTDRMNCGACGTVCPPAQSCVAGLCACPLGRTLCGGACVDPATDGSNCGICGRVCSGPTTCIGGACGCPGLQTLCGSTCVNTATDSANCGTCGRSCGSGQSCMSGACTCVGGLTLCGSACVNTLVDSNHCGGCGRMCGSGQSCSSGSCTCIGSLTLCGSACVNTQVDGNHCGGCGRVCGPGQSCSSGSCTCTSPTTLCSGVCVNTSSDSSNCGWCGRVCTGGQTCSLGSCACASPTSLCSGVCVNLSSSTTDCGWCGHVCGSGQVCSGGSCTCTGGLTLCGGACVNTATDTSNCGLCGRVCSTGQTCTGGTCVSTSGGGTFQITSLGSTGCARVEHNTVTGDDRGGIAVSTSQVFYTGDSATGRFSMTDLSGGTSVGRMYDGLLGNVRTGTVYALAVGATPISGWGGTVSVDRLLGINGSTGALDGTSVILSTPISMNTAYGSNVGIFSGWDRAVILANGRAYNIALPAGTVTDLGAMTVPAHMECENWAFWGVAEYFGGTLYVDYLQGPTYPVTTVARTSVPAGVTTALATFTSLSDMCSFTVSPATNRWYFHHEGSSQFGGADESVGYCPAAMVGTSGGYTQGVPPGSVTFVDACSVSGHATLLPSVDDAYAAQPLPFAFTFYGRPYAAGTSVNISSNGFFNLDGTMTAVYWGTTLNIPSTDLPNAVVAASWRDLDTRTGGICVATVGTAPSRRWIVEWVDARDHGYDEGHFTFEAILNEGSNAIDLLYSTMTNSMTRPRSVGIENPDGTAGISVCSWGDGATPICTVVTTGTRIRFTP